MRPLADPDRIRKAHRIVTIGMQDTIIIDTPDALLICNRRDAQKDSGSRSNFGKIENGKYL